MGQQRLVRARLQVKACGWSFLALWLSDALLSTVAASSRETELQSKLDSADKRLQRLKEVFQKTVKDFRSACYELTGFTLEVTTVDGGVR